MIFGWNNNNSNNKTVREINPRSNNKILLIMQKINNQQHAAIACVGQALKQWHPYVNTTISTLILKRNLRD